jgi:3-dehydroquinate synthetase
LGLVAAARLSDRLGLGGGLEERVSAAVRRVGLDADLDPWLRDDVLSYIGVDKKRAGGKVRFVALQALGRPVLHEVAPAEVGQILRSPKAR